MGFIDIRQYLINWINYLKVGDSVPIKKWVKTGIIKVFHRKQFNGKFATLG